MRIFARELLKYPALNIDQLLRHAGLRSSQPSSALQVKQASCCPLQFGARGRCHDAQQNLVESVRVEISLLFVGRNSYFELINDMSDNSEFCFVYTQAVQSKQIDHLSHIWVLQEVSENRQDPQFRLTVHDEHVVDLQQHIVAHLLHRACVKTMQLLFAYLNMCVRARLCVYVCGVHVGRMSVQVACVLAS